MGLRDRHQERRDERRGITTYQMRQKLVSIGDDYWIQDSQGNRAYKIDGKALRVRETLLFEDTDGHELYKIQSKMLHIRDTMEIEDGNGHKVATVKKALITPLRDRFEVKVENGSDMEAKGNIVEHEYKIERDGNKVAEVSKKWFRVADTYGVEVQSGVEPSLILAVTAVIDSMANPAR
ncbi:MAG: LURP-one-related family protein [Nocardioides sp.]